MSSYSDFSELQSRTLQNKGDALATAKANSAATWGNTVANLGQVIPEQVQKAMKVAAQKKQEAQIQSIFQQSGGDLEKAANEVMKVSPEIGMRLLEQNHKAKTLAYEMQELDWKHQQQKAELEGRLLNGVNDEDSYAEWALGQHQLGRKVPDHYDPVFIRGEKMKHVSVLDSLKLEQPKEPKAPGTRAIETVKDGVAGTEIVEDVPGGFYPKPTGSQSGDKLPTSVEALRTIAANAKDPRQEEAAAILENLPESVRITGPEMDERYRRIMAKPGKARTGDEIAWAGAYERQKAVSQPAVVIQTDQGPRLLDRRNKTADVITTPEGETVNAPPTQPQALDAAFAKRLEDSGKVLTKLTPKITKMNLVDFEAQRRLPPAAQSFEMQQYMQAARNMINAVLRRESGAAIQASEFDDARKQYLPVPGDGPEVLQQKAQNILRQREGLIQGAGPAYRPDVVSDKVRVKGPNGERGTMPKSSALPPGWSLEK